MPYPAPTSEQLERFNEDGFLVVENAIDPQELDALVQMGHEMIERPLDPKANGLGLAPWRAARQARVSHRSKRGRSALSLARHFPLPHVGCAVWRSAHEPGDGILVRAIPGETAVNRRTDAVASRRSLLGPHAAGSRSDVLDRISFRRPGKRLHALRARRTQALAPASQSAGDGQRPAPLRNSGRRRGRRLPDRRGHRDVSITARRRT